METVCSRANKGLTAYIPAIFLANRAALFLKIPELENIILASSATMFWPMPDKDSKLDFCITLQVTEMQPENIQRRYHNQRNRIRTQLLRSPCNCHRNSAGVSSLALHILNRVYYPFLQLLLLAQHPFLS